MFGGPMTGSESIGVVAVVEVKDESRASTIGSEQAAFFCR